MSQEFACPNCGHRWRKGQHGGHDCVGRLKEQRDALLEAMKTTLGNIMSLGPAGALESVPMPYKVWAEVCQAAIEKAHGGKTAWHGMS